LETEAQSIMQTVHTCVLPRLTYRAFYMSTWYGTLSKEQMQINFTEYEDFWMQFEIKLVETAA
jgi:hypothetical protein